MPYTHSEVTGNTEQISEDLMLTLCPSAREGGSQEWQPRGCVRPAWIGERRRSGWRWWWPLGWRDHLFVRAMGQQPDNALRASRVTWTYRPCTPSAPDPGGTWLTLASQISFLFATIKVKPKIVKMWSRWK